MRRSKQFGALCAILLLVSASSAFAQAADPTDSLLGVVQAAMQSAASDLYEKVYRWLGAFVILQFTISGVKKLTEDGTELGGALSLFFRAMMSAGVCLYLIDNGPEFINSVGQMFLRDAVALAPSVKDILAGTIGLCGGLVAAMLGIGVISTPAANLVGYLLMAVLGIGLYMATKLFMLQLELGMVVLLAPFNFTLLGLNQLREQGIAPFKSLLALIYRIILAGIILGAFSALLANAGNVVNAVGWKDAAAVGATLKNFLYSLIGLPILAFLMFKSDSIAAQLASGSSGMGVSDVAGAAVAAGAAGAAIAAGGAAAGGAASKPASSMRDFLQGLGGSISNASATGSAEPPPLKPGGSPASFSTNGPSAGGGSTSAPGAASQPAAAPSSGDGPSAGTTPPTGADAAPGSSAADPSPVASGKIGPDLSGQAEAQPEAGQGGQAGSGRTASISGAGGGQSGLEQQLGRLADQMEQEQARKNKKPGLRETLAEANKHVEKEQATVGVSINTHHHD